MAKTPFSDTTPKNSLIIPRGRYEFLEVALKVGGVILPPDSDAFQRLDIVTIKDPDENIVTSSWVTSDLDPDDGEDVYNSSHANYVGLQARKTVNDGVTTSGSAIVTSATASFNSNDLNKTISGTGIPVGATIVTITSLTQVTISANATANGTGVSLTIGAENIGLFHNGSGRIAQKVRAPTNAEVTVGTSRRWKVEWKIKKNGVFVTDFEYFHVDNAGVLIFSSDIVTIAEVEGGITTALTDAQIELLIVEATSHVEGLLELCGVDPDKFDPVPKIIHDAIVLYARSLIFDMDASAFKKVASLQEGSKRVGFAGNSSKDADSLRMRADSAVNAYCKEFGSHRRPRFKVVRQKIDDADFTEEN